MPLNASALEVGRDYRVFYQNPDEDLPREMIAGFLGERGGVATLWDLSPWGGAQAVPTRWITAIWETDRPRAAPRPARGERRVF